MSSSFVPKIGLSKGTSRKTKFDISNYAHTTAEVGYFQPTFSKILMPNSDLKVKVSDSILMSSLVVPTFGDLFLRHWFTATPISSLWACLGAFLTGRDYTDLDSPTGYGKYAQMPMVSLNEFLATIKAMALNGIQNCNDLMFGNLAFAIDSHRLTKDNNGKRNWSEIFYSFVHNSPSRNQSGLKAFLTGCNMFGYDYSADMQGYRPTYQRFVKTANTRYRLPVDIFGGGALVIENNDDWLYRSLDSAGNPTLPTKEDCPYLLLRWTGRNMMDCIQSAKHYVTDTASVSDEVGSVFPSDWYVTPLTMRMYQGDTDYRLYEMCGASAQAKVVSEGATKILRMAPSSETGVHPFVLASDDAYFTGDLSNAKFDYYSYCNGTIASVPANYKFGCNWSRRYKRMRKLFVGLGYQFNPHDTEPQTFWKLMAYYKSWFDMSYPKREVQYNHTPLARLVNFISYHSSACSKDMLDQFFSKAEYFLGSGDSTRGQEYFKRLIDFIDLVIACTDARYLMPLDYYSLADPNPNTTGEYTGQYDGSDSRDEIMVGVGVGSTDEHNYPKYDVIPPMVDGSSVGASNNYYFSGRDVTNTGVGFGFDGWTNKMATKMLTYLTKKRIVGKSVADTMRAIFGSSDEHDKTHESCWCFGNSQTKINVSAVMSQAETEEMHLGDFAGRGVGGSTSRQYSIDNNGDLLVVICMSAIVPRLSYYQGHSRENMIGESPNEFCKPMWDAVGYDDVKTSEYIADYVDVTSDVNERQQKDLNDTQIGLVPRYTWYKVNGHDILNGDMSLPSSEDSMKPYVLTRDVSHNFDIDPLSMRTFDPDTFNRIFNESSSLDDHFIIQCKFDVDMYAPLKSISTSFETFDEDEDGTIEVEHA